jgi:hypothetical protein
MILFNHHIVVKEIKDLYTYIESKYINAIKSLERENNKAKSIEDYGLPTGLK